MRQAKGDRQAMKIQYNPDRFKEEMLELDPKLKIIHKKGGPRIAIRETDKGIKVVINPAKVHTQEQLDIVTNAVLQSISNA